MAHAGLPDLTHTNRSLTIGTGNVAILTTQTTTTTTTPHRTLRTASLRVTTCPQLRHGRSNCGHWGVLPPPLPPRPVAFDLHGPLDTRTHLGRAEGAWPSECTTEGPTARRARQGAGVLLAVMGCHLRTKGRGEPPSRVGSWPWPRLRARGSTRNA